MILVLNNIVLLEPCENRGLCRNGKRLLLKGKKSSQTKCIPFCLRDEEKP
jgi:hypothetical protein